MDFELRYVMEGGGTRFYVGVSLSMTATRGFPVLFLPKTAREVVSLLDLYQRCRAEQLEEARYCTALCIAPAPGPAPAPAPAPAPSL